MFVEIISLGTLSEIRLESCEMEKALLCIGNSLFVMYSPFIESSGSSSSRQAAVSCELFGNEYAGSHSRVPGICRCRRAHLSS